MRYIVSDIHGCYDQYRALLGKIHFSDDDKFYVLSDVVDRGPESLKVLQDMRKRSNVVFILGNHDFTMYSLLRHFAVEVTEAMTSPSQTETDAYYLLGDLTTGEEIYDTFLLEGTAGYLSFCGHQHTGSFASYPGGYCDADRPAVWHNAAGNVYMMDCGCGFADGRLACFCLETGERFYV